MRRTASSRRRRSPRAALGRVPRRRRGHDPVGDRAEVEDRVGQRRGAREALGVAQRDVGERAVGDDEPRPVRPHEHACRARAIGTVSPTRASARCRRTVGSSPSPSTRSSDDRVVDVHPLGLRLLVVVRHLVGGDVGLHLQRADGDVARARAAHGRRTARAARRRRSPACQRARTRLRSSGAAAPAATIAQAELHRPRQPHWREACRTALDARASGWSARLRLAAVRRDAASRAPRLRDERGDHVALRSASGCHWTPSAKRRSGSSIASGSSSRSSRRSRRGPRRGGRRPGGDATAVGVRASPAARRRERARAQATSWSAPSKDPSTRRCSRVAEALGQVLHQRAAAARRSSAACRGRCRATGMSRSIARARERDLELVALGHRVVGLRRARSCP